MTVGRFPVFPGPCCAVRPLPTAALSQLSKPACTRQRSAASMPLCDRCQKCVVVGKGGNTTCCFFCRPFARSSTPMTPVCLVRTAFLIAWGSSESAIRAVLNVYDTCLPCAHCFSDCVGFFWITQLGILGRTAKQVRLSN